jgi:hypothetical protein
MARNPKLVGKLQSYAVWLLRDRQERAIDRDQFRLKRCSDGSYSQSAGNAERDRGLGCQ